MHNLLLVHEEIEEGDLGEAGVRAVVAENEELGDGNEAGGGLVQLDQEELICEDIPVVTAENLNLEIVQVAADFQNLEEEIEDSGNSHSKDV